MSSKPAGEISMLTRLALDVLRGAGIENTVLSAETALGDLSLDEIVHHRALLGLLCAAYVDRESIPASVVPKILAILGKTVRPETTRAAKALLQSLLVTPLAKLSIKEMVAALSRPDIAKRAILPLMETLEYGAAWARSALDPDALLSLAEAEHLRSYRAPLLRRVLEPCVYAAGGSFTETHLQRFIRAYREDPRLPYCLYIISQWKQFSDAVRECAARFTQDSFPLKHDVARRLSGSGRRLLVVHNIRDGQGDEMIRCVPLMNAFLDFNGALEVVVISRRTYLYANPRVTAVSILDRTQVNALLDQPFDAIIDFFEPNIRELNYDFSLETRVREYVQQREPFLFASSLKGFNCFLFECLELEGRAIADALGLNLLHIANSYEPTCRLIAELGLPLRCGEDPPGQSAVIAGTDCPNASGSWRNLLRTAEARPVALLNPFGGAESLKGVVGQNLGVMVKEIEALIEEGYFVVLIPNGMPWGDAGAALQLTSLVNESLRVNLAIAPDPAAANADAVMRQFTWFVRFADLIVTVEGWMMHLAWLLGKPYRVLMLSYSHDTCWHPYTRTLRQDMQSCYRLQTGLLSENDPPPLPEQPRKLTLIALLLELCETKADEVLSIARKALCSQDRYLRRAALDALVNFQESLLDQDLLQLLGDTDNGVRFRAARLLLERPTLASVAPDTCRAHILIGQPGRDWDSVIKLGDASRPALAMALKDDDLVIQREAAHAQRLLDLSAARTRRKQRAL